MAACDFRHRYHHTDIETLIKSDTSIDFDHLVFKSARTKTIEHDHGASNRELLLAAQKGDLADIKRLKTKRANLLGADYDGRTALHIAAKHGHLDVVKYLVSTIDAINVNVQDSQHNTPYTEALKASQGEVAEFLLSKGATNLNDTNAGSLLCQAAHKGDIEQIKKAVKEGVSLRSADYDGRTALHLAAAAGHVELIKYLISPGRDTESINVNSKDRWGGTPLDDAERCGHPEAAKTLRKCGADDVAHLQVRFARQSEIGLGNTSIQADGANTAVSLV